MKINAQKKAMKKNVHEMGKKEGLKEGKEKGLKEGEEKGLKRGKEEMAKQLKNKGIDIEIIVQASGLSIEEIKAL